MTGTLRNLGAGLARVVLSLRYRVRVVGLEHVTARRGVLLLPNHPGYTDPPLVLAHLGPRFAPRPMLLASMFTSPLLAWLPRALRALPIPDLAQPSVAARGQIEDALAAIAAGLGRGENFVLWPSGRAQRDGRELLGGNRSVAEILARAPDAKLVLVRTRGLRGSMFSYARTGGAPHLTRCLLKAVGLLCANLLLLMPRRRIEIVVEEVDRDALPGLAREQLNPFLEAWYTAPGVEPPVHVPYRFLFGARTFAFPPPPAAAGGSPADVDRGTRDAVTELLRARLGEQPGLSEPDTALDALGLDSLDRTEVALELEDRFGFRVAGVPATVGDLWALAAGLAGGAVDVPVPAAWSADRSRPGEVRIDGETILEALVRRAARSGREVVAADDLSGVVTYERFVVAVAAFARRIERAVAVPNVGILLPSSVATDILIFAVHLAGRTPVMVNWTTGPANVAHAARAMGLTHVLTSRRFVDRTGVSVEGAELMFVEDVRAAIPRLELLVRLLRTRLFPRHLLRRLPPASRDDPAVVLFTSGSERAPKAVPLTHHNVLSNLRAVLEGYAVDRADVFLAFLPPFHSFGFTLTVLLPILGGCRVVHHPDPTDAAALARKLHAFGATLLGATPTFLGYILAHATPDRLASLRWAIVGGERCPDALFDEFARKAPHAELLEGYGVTECAPLVAGTRPGADHRGTIGLPLPGVELSIVDPDSREPVPDGEPGMLLVRGPNVFPGYLGDAGASPFHDVGGVRWYVTGDLVVRDPAGRHRFVGRLKRFLKAGGEMISLPAIEEPLARAYPPTDAGPRVAVEGVDEPVRRIVLFTTEPVTPAEANAVLAAAGLRGVLRIDEVRRVDAIPLLGTGKIDHKVLRRALEAPGSA